MSTSPKPARKGYSLTATIVGLLVFAALILLALTKASKSRDLTSPTIEPAKAPQGPLESAPAKPQKLIEFATRGSWSPDGNKVLFGRPMGGGLIILDLATQQETELTKNGKDGEWSPDGRHIVYIQEPQFDSYNQETAWVIEPNGKGGRKVGLGGHPQWSKDGRTLFLSSRLAPEIHAYSVDAPEAPARIIFKKTQSWYNAVSPDGRRVAYGTDGAFIMADMESGESILNWMTPTRERGLLPSWSPDGSMVGFGGYNGSPSGIWVMDVTTETAAQVIPGPFTMPVWSKDGSKLLFDRRLGDEREIWSVSQKYVDGLLSRVAEKQTLQKK